MIRFVGTAHHGKETLLYFTQRKSGYICFALTRSRDGFKFEDTFEYVGVRDDKKRTENDFHWQGLRIAKQKEKYFLTYRQKGKKSSPLTGALSDDLVRWEKTGKIADVKETGAVVPDYKHRDHYVMYYGDKEIKIAYSAYLYHWKTQKNPVLLKPRKHAFDSGPLEVGNAYVVDEHILLLYYTRRERDGKTLYAVGGAIFDKQDPTELLWRSDEPLFEQPGRTRRRIDTAAWLSYFT